MVFDSIKNAKHYYGLSAGIKLALKYFEGYDADAHENTRVELDGESVFINRMSYLTAPPASPKLEAHREYIDVMYVAAGEEKFLTKPLGEIKTLSAQYDAAIDACFADIDEQTTPVRFPAGYFCIFFPEDAHCAGQLWDKPSEVKKLVAKVKVNA